MQVETVPNYNSPLCFPLLTPRNVAFVEAIIKIDSTYRKAGDEKQEHTPRYCGSPAYWLVQLRELLSSANPKDDDFKSIIEGAVKALDTANSTHLNSDNVGLEQITTRICEYYKNNPRKLKEDLKTRESAKELFCKIAQKTVLSETQENSEKKYHARENFSFASKFCRNASYYLFEGEEQNDTFSIYDSVLAQAVRIYSLYYLGEDCTLEYKGQDAETMWSEYCNYCDIIDKIREKCGEEQISRNGFDHILWYYFKGRERAEIKIMRKQARAAWERRYKI